MSDDSNFPLGIDKAVRWGLGNPIAFLRGQVSQTFLKTLFIAGRSNYVPRDDPDLCITLTDIK